MIVLDKLKPLSFTFRSCYECSLKSDNKMCSPGLYSKQKYFQCDKIGYQLVLASTCSGALLEQVSPLVTTLWKLQKLEYAVYNILYILYTMYEIIHFYSSFIEHGILWWDGIHGNGIYWNWIKKKWKWMQSSCSQRLWLPLNFE